MTKDELAMISMQIVTFSGVAKSNAMMAMEEATERNFDAIDELFATAEENLKLAAKQHFEALQADALGELEMNVLFIHAEDQMLSAETAVSLAKRTIDMFKSLV